FFFQAEDGIRDRTVTGVQTCALPIYGNRRRVTIEDPLQWSPEDPAADRAGKPRVERGDHRDPGTPGGERCGQAERRSETAVHVRSEERRVERVELSVVAV